MKCNFVMCTGCNECATINQMSGTGTSISDGLGLAKDLVESKGRTFATPLRLPLLRGARHLAAGCPRRPLRVCARHDAQRAAGGGRAVVAQVDAHVEQALRLIVLVGLPRVEAVHVPP